MIPRLTPQRSEVYLVEAAHSRILWLLISVLYLSTAIILTILPTTHTFLFTHFTPYFDTHTHTRTYTLECLHRRALTSLAETASVT
jgi:hypothetical protein